MKKYSILGLFLLVCSQVSHAGLIRVTVDELYSHSTKLYDNSVSLVIDNAAPAARLTYSTGYFDNAIKSGFFLRGGSRYDLSLSSVNTIRSHTGGVSMNGYMTDALGNVEDFYFHFVPQSISIASLSFIDVGAGFNETIFDLGPSMFYQGVYTLSAVADVSEPAAIVLFIFGLAGVVARRRLKANE